MSRRVVVTADMVASNRLEINDFIKNEKYFSLFILALRHMQQDEQHRIASYFQISKIHGLPYKPWNNAFDAQSWDPSRFYCTHGSVLFPTWHRLYMMLHEQIIQAYAIHIAATYTVDRNAWKHAAQSLRYPFWDWAVNAVPPDEVIAMPEVVITGPDGQKVSVHNPLYHYIFHPINSSFPVPFCNWPATVRHPSTQGPGATDNVARLKSVLQAAQPDVTSSTYNMLTRIHDWHAFSNHTVGDGGSTSNSLEAIHDGIHGNVGGGGQMSDPTVAAFDPIFFLHHCNVDRLLQLWSALNPDVWVTRNEAESGTHTIPASLPVDQPTALMPFLDRKFSFWDSSALKDTTELGYIYPDFNGLDLSDTSAVQTAIAHRVIQLYGSSVFSGQRTIPVSPFVPHPSSPSPISSSASTQPPFGGRASAPDVILPSGDMPRGTPQAAANLNAHIMTNRPTGQAISIDSASPWNPVAIASVVSPSYDTDSVYHDASIPNQGLFDWTARIIVQKYEAGGSFGVLLFLGEVPDNPHNWNISPNYVGSHYAFANTSVSKCRCQANVVVEGFVHLNESIVKHSTLDSLEPNVVEPYLKSNLHWRVQSISGDPVNAPSLEVSIYATPLSYPPGAIFPVAGERRLCTAITHGREGGRCAKPPWHVP